VHCKKFLLKFTIKEKYSRLDSFKAFYNYFFFSGLDGGTSGLEREKLINAFNTPNSNAKLFLLSTR
jgi:SNF2 family DNA or RNA helicase